MGRIDDASQPLSTHVSVYLRGCEVGVPEQFLHSTKIGTAIQEMSGEGVAERVRMRGNGRTVVEDAPDIARGQRTCSSVQEQGIVRLVGRRA
jgi:hypothetical protein